MTVGTIFEVQIIRFKFHPSWAWPCLTLEDLKTLSSEMRRDVEAGQFQSFHWGEIWLRQGEPHKEKEVSMESAGNLSGNDPWYTNGDNEGFSKLFRFWRGWLSSAGHWHWHAGFLKKLSHIHGALIWINVSREVGTMTTTCVVGMEIKMPP